MSSISPPRRTLANDTIVRTYRQPLVSEPAAKTTIFDRMQAGDRSAATECLETYGSFIWGIAKKQTRSIQEAEHVTECVFKDIFKGEGFKLRDISEREAIQQITVRCIIRHKFENRNVF